MKDMLPIPFKAINLEINGTHFIADILNFKMTVNAFEKYISTGLFTAKIDIDFRDKEKVKKFEKEHDTILSNYENFGLKVNYKSKNNMFDIVSVKETDFIVYGSVNCQSNISIGYLNQNTLVVTDYGLLIVSGDSEIIVNYRTEELYVDYVLRNQITCNLMKKRFKFAEMRVVK